MMSSVIPARLLFQCGHAALVSLPRVKGESSAQRTDRIAREKSAAQSRSCDFCPPMALAEVAQAVVVVAAMPEPVVPVASGALVAEVAEPVALPSVAVGPREEAMASSDPVASTGDAASTDVAARTDTAKLPARRVTRRRRSSAAVVQPPVATEPVARNGAARNGRATHNGHVASYRFVVRFRTETLLQATDIRDALRQAESLGAAEVLRVAAMG